MLRGCRKLAKELPPPEKGDLVNTVQVIKSLKECEWGDPHHALCTVKANRELTDWLAAYNRIHHPEGL